MAVCGGEPPPSPPVGLGLMSCVKQENPPLPHSHEGKKKGFHPFRGLRRMFRRRQRAADVQHKEIPVVEARSRSASQLIDQSNNVVHSGLSVSHDSVFCPSQHSAVSSSLSIHQIPSHTSVAAELADAIRRRRGKEENSDEEDMGLPASPIGHSPTTADVLLETNIKESINKSSHSTCSEGSLLSMASSEMEEDSRTSSKLSLQDKKSITSRDIVDEFSLAGNINPTLSHSAARHKMAVRPKRKHAAARHRNHMVALPATPEVNEEPIVAVPIVRNMNVPSNITKEVTAKSASLPAGVTPGDAWGVASQDGFFTRLLARRSGKKKKNVESRQRVQPLTIPAPNIPKSQSFRKDEKLPFGSLDTPSLPNVESTCVWVSKEKSHLQQLDDSYTSVNTEPSFVWVSQESYNEQSLSIHIGESDNHFVDDKDDQTKVSVNGICLSTSEILPQKDIETVNSVTNSLETTTANNNSQKCSVVSIIPDENKDEENLMLLEKINSCNQSSFLTDKASQSKDISDFTDSKHIMNEDLENILTPQLKQSKMDILKVELKDDAEDSETYEIEKQNKTSFSDIDYIKYEKSKDSTSSDLQLHKDIELSQSLENIILPKQKEAHTTSAIEKKESFRFEIKSIADTKVMSDIAISDRKLSLSELSSVFEKKIEEGPKPVTRQKSFSFGKQNVPTVDTTSLRKSFEGVSKLDSSSKKNADPYKCKVDSFKSSSDTDSPSKTPNFLQHDMKEKFFDKSFERNAEIAVDLSKSSQTLSDVEIVLRRRPSREILKQKEEEPELLKVFARRSLKVKDVEEELPIKSRDSDKENEDSSERKKSEYQRSISTEDCILSIHNVCRQRSKTLPELSQQKPLNVYKEVEAASSDKEEKSDEPKFIRIQQRKEEWEKRAQQAMGK